MCEESAITSIVSIVYLILCFAIPLAYLIIYFKIKRRKRKKNPGKAFTIALVIFALLYGFKMIANLSDDKMQCVNCYINNKCHVDEGDDDVDKTTTTTKEKDTTEDTTTTTTTKKTTASTPGTYGKVAEISGSKESVGTSSKGFEIYKINGITYVDGYLIANKSYSLPADYVPSDTYKSAEGATNTCNSCINNTVYKAWQKMQSAAANDGIKIHIGSGYRPYKTQMNIYNNYVARDGKEKADTYSARAGSSEHQTALCFDICGTNLPGSKCISSAFNDTAEAKWIDQNAHKFGFIIRYPKNKMDETGYKYESWHVRYVGTELANKLYNNGDWISMENYFGITSKYSD